MIRADETDDKGLRRVVRRVMLLNLGYFGIEFAVAVAIGSVSLFADSVDFLEDTSVNFLILVALGWTAARRAQVGMLLAGILLIPAVATLWSENSAISRARINTAATAKLTSVTMIPASIPATANRPMARLLRAKA